MGRKIMFLRRHAIRAPWSEMYCRENPKGFRAAIRVQPTIIAGVIRITGASPLITYTAHSIVIGFTWRRARGRIGGCGGTGLQRRYTTGANVGNANTAEGVGRRGGHDRFGGGRERIFVSFCGRWSAADLRRRSFGRRMFAGACQVLRQRRRQSNGN